jgi:hypothetical protein
MDFRTMAAKLATSVPQLCVYENLELHFEWICDGCIKGMVEENEITFPVSCLNVAHNCSLL